MIAAGLPSLADLKKLKHPDELIRTSNAWKEYVSYHPYRLPAYHDFLLYLFAFPLNRAVLVHAHAAMEEMQKLCALIMQRKNTALHRQLSGTGIAHTRLTCSYSFALVCWLTGRYPDSVSLGGSDATPEEIVAVFRILTPGVLFEKVTQRELGLAARIRAITGIQSPHTQLKWLIGLFNSSELSESIKEVLYQTLKVFICWKMDTPAFSRSGLSLPAAKIHFQKKGIATVYLHKIIAKPVQQVSLTNTDKNSIIDTVRTALAFYYRETDPFTYADPDELTLFDAGQGLQVALVGMKKEQRLSLESYVGYMAFSNGIPVAYGGGWIWGNRCRIGLNIFPPFRKAGSDGLFCQVMGVYHQYFNAAFFIVRPYQFGKGNHEGIRSGAFWFYYRLGYRPASASLRNIAADEWTKIKKDKRYRTPVSLLKKFTTADLEYNTGVPAIPTVGADAVSAIISRNAGGAVKKATEHAMKKVSKLFPSVKVCKPGFPEPVRNNFLLLVQSIPEIDHWSVRDRKALAHLFELKAGGKEIHYIKKSQAHRQLWNSLDTLCTIKM